jgi:hypothetical protein
MRVQGTCTGAVVVTHLGSPVATDGWHYFNGLPGWVGINAIVDGFPKGGTSPRRQRCDA